MSFKFNLFKSEGKNPNDISNTLMFLGLFGLVIISLYGFADVDHYISKVSQCILLAIATASIGLFIGFLFGIPKHTSKTASGRYTSNTNLEEISDWLTKILVGLGLAQLTFIPGKFIKLVNYLSSSISGVPKDIIASIIIYFLLFGFFTGYLITRLYLSKKFAETEDDLSQQLSNNVERLASEPEKTINTDNQYDKNALRFIDDSIEKPVSEIIIQTKEVEESGGKISAQQYFKQGRIMVMNQNYLTAKEYFLKSYELDKNYKAGSNAAVIMSRFLQHYPEADKILTELIEAHPKEPLGYYNRACNYVRTDSFDLAIEDLRKAIEFGREAFKNEALKDQTFEPLKGQPKFIELLPGYGQI